MLTARSNSLQMSERPSTTAHAVRLFDGSDSLARTVSGFVLEGLTREETVLVVATPEHWLAILDGLVRQGADVTGAITRGQLTVMDAATLLQRFAPRGRPDPAIFDEVIGGFVRQLVARGVPLRIYGEMVNLLAAEGAFADAERLEILWNELGTASPFNLLCGYSAVHFGHGRSEDALQRICKTHTCVEASIDDSLSLWLLTQGRSSQPPVN
jgi:hypothetical protein